MSSFSMNGFYDSDVGLSTSSGSSMSFGRSGMTAAAAAAAESSATHAPLKHMLRTRAKRSATARHEKKPVP